MSILIRVLVLLLTLGFQGGGASHEAAVIDGPVHNGVEVQVDLPPSEWVENIGLGPNHDVGCCVWASLDADARWHNYKPLIGILRKMKEGGGWPAKMDAIIKEHAPGTQYTQCEDTDPAILDDALSRRVPVCVTYGFGELYVGPSNPTGAISHMVLLVHLDAKYACIIDNNFVKKGERFWMSRDEFLRRWICTTGKGWAVVLNHSVPPPPPRNFEP